MPETPPLLPCTTREKKKDSYYLRHSSPRASVRCRFGPLSASFDLFDLYFLLSAGFGVLSAGFGVLSAGFPETKK